MPQTDPDFDILVAGGGPAGMTAAAAFADAGYRVLCIDPDPPVTDAEDDNADLRTTALLQPSRDFLDRLGIWEGIEPYAMPLQVMRIVDAATANLAPRLVRDFEAADLGSLPFGWNVPNTLLRRELSRDLAARERVEHRTGVAVTDLATRTGAAVLRLDDGSRVAARLAVAADGRGSTVRNRLGIGVRVTRYGQKALAFAVTHETSHGGVSTEIHRSGGPFTLVPLPDRDGVPCSAVVWMTPAAEAESLYHLDDAAFSAAATARSGALYGPLTVAGGRRIWPIVSQTAERLAAERVALVAEAAHVVPPIGAQGMNMSLADIRTLVEVASASDDPGAPHVLAAYARRRTPEIRLRVAGVDALNRASIAGIAPARDLRRLGIAALHGLRPVRQTLMQLGLGARG